MQKPYRFIGSTHSIGGVGSFQRFGQKAMFTDEQAERFVYRLGGAPFVPDAEWQAAWKDFKAGVEHFDQPSSHAGAGEEFGTIKVQLCDSYSAAVAKAEGQRLAAKRAKPTPAPKSTTQPAKAATKVEA